MTVVGGGGPGLENNELSDTQYTVQYNIVHDPGQYLNLQRVVVDHVAVLRRIRWSVSTC